jgi:hypothetical protein
MSEAGDEPTICANCRHYIPFEPCGEPAFWVLHTLRNCHKGKKLGINYISGREIWTFSCSSLNKHGDCEGFEQGKPMTLISDSVWWKPWTWGTGHWEMAE